MSPHRTCPLTALPDPVTRFAAALLILALAAFAGAGDAARGVIHRDGVAPLNAWIILENLDGVRYSIDKDGIQVAEFKRGKYIKVEFKDESDNKAYENGLKEIAKERYDTAVKMFENAVRLSKTFWVPERALLKLAECHLALGKPDAALAAVAQFEKQTPRSVLLGRAITLRGRAALALKKPEDATAAATALESRAELGAEAPIQAKVLKAGAARAGAKPADAAALLETVFTPDTAKLMPNDWAEIGLTLATDLAAASRSDAAYAVVRQLAYSGLDDSVAARAHLSWALLLGNANAAAAAAAFDHAALATTYAKGLPSVNTPATALVKRLASQLDKDPAVSAEDKREYRIYAGKF